jgi:hypothetical protein
MDDDFKMPSIGKIIGWVVLALVAIGVLDIIPILE